MGSSPTRRSESSIEGRRAAQARKIPIEKILIKGSTFSSIHLKWRLIEEGIKELKCEKCGNTEWLGQPIPIELHHIDGDKTNNTLENLEILCPNCHSFTDTYCGKNNKRNLNKSS